MMICHLPLTLKYFSRMYQVVESPLISTSYILPPRGGVRVGGEGHVLDTHLHLSHHPLLKLEPLGPVDYLVTDGAGHDDHVSLVTAPPLEDLEAEAGVKHPRGSEHNHGSGVVNVRSVK